MEGIFDSEIINYFILTIVIYCAVLIMVRLTDKRILSSMTAFDVIVTIILGSVLSRAINGRAPLIPTIIAGATLVGLHLLAAMLSYHSAFFRRVLRGKHRTLVRDGKIVRDQMAGSHIPENDLLVELRKRTNSDSLENIKEARMETCGTITFTLKKK